MENNTMMSIITYDWLYAPYGFFHHNLILNVNIVEYKQIKACLDFTIPSGKFLLMGFLVISTPIPSY
jgi:hypothetical protein